MRFLFGVTAALAIAFSLLSSEAVCNDGTSTSKRVTMVRLLQGEEVKLPGDFVARLDGDKLKVALKSFGADQRNPGREMLVSLIQDDGTKSELPLNDNGEVTFPGVKEGLVALVMATGQSAYLALPLFAEPAAPNAEPLENPFEVPIASVDANQIRQQVDSSGNSSQSKGTPTALKDYKKVVVNHYRVRLRKDGSLVGRVIVPEGGFERSAGECNVSFYQRGSFIGGTVSNADGSFAVEGLVPGFYSVVASGAPGHAAFGFEVVEAATEVASKKQLHWSQGLLVSVQTDVVPADELVILLIPPRMMPAVKDIVNNAYALPLETVPPPIDGGVVGAPAAGYAAPGYAGSFGGGGFSGGGGGGGFGGIGGIGGLLGIAGLAVGVAALADDDDNGNNLPATPVVP